jgi:hypothetical protein
MKKTSVKDYLSSDLYSKRLRDGGIEYLIRLWELTSEQVPFNDRYLLDEYLSDLMSREVLDELFEHCEVDESIYGRCCRADSLFQKKTIKVPECLVNVERLGQRVSDVEKCWYYYRVPAERIGGWFGKGK